MQKDLKDIIGAAKAGHEQGKRMGSGQTNPSDNVWFIVGLIIVGVILFAFFA